MSEVVVAVVDSLSIINVGASDECFEADFVWFALLPLLRSKTALVNIANARDNASSSSRSSFSRSSTSLIPSLHCSGSGCDSDADDRWRHVELRSECADFDADAEADDAADDDGK